jgi:glycosyltransferase involved in cell wall biosynthesis
MNVLCLDQFSELGGGERCLLELLPALAREGWSAHVAAPGRGPLAERAAALGATYDPIAFGPYSSGRKTPAEIARFAAETPRLARAIGALIRRYHADLLYVNGPRLLPAAALAAPKAPPLLFHSHAFLTGYQRRLAGWPLRLARAAVVGCCQYVAGPLMPYARGGLRVVYNGVSCTLPARTESPREPFRIGLIGRISPEKGHTAFLGAARLLHRGGPPCSFLICGSPLFADAAAGRYLRHIEALAEGLPVEFCGWQDDVQRVLARLDVLVVPSAPVEATPRVILEGFAAGVPVVAFASGGIPEIIEHNVTGFLAPERSPEALAATLGELLRQPQRLSQAAARARLKTATQFTLERYQAHMLEALAYRCRSQVTRK